MNLSCWNYLISDIHITVSINAKRACPATLILTRHTLIFQYYFTFGDCSIVYPSIQPDISGVIENTKEVTPGFQSFKVEVL